VISPTGCPEVRESASMAQQILHSFSPTCPRPSPSADDSLASTTPFRCPLEVSLTSPHHSLLSIPAGDTKKLNVPKKQIVVHSRLSRAYLIRLLAAIRPTRLLVSRWQGLAVREWLLCTFCRTS
jgi:hypothetical protein